MSAAPEPTATATPAAPRLVQNRLVRALLMLLAVLSLGLGLLGLFLPGLPTTEFVLIAAWAAARSSPRLHQWMLNHRLLGPLLVQWQAGRLPRRAKWAATLAMSLAATALLLHLPWPPPWWVVAALVSMACVLAWLWSRPEPLR